MGEKFKIVSSRLFRKNYKNEREYSIANFGEAHATKYFRKIRQKVLSLEEARLEKPLGDSGDYRIINSIKGIHILYHINKADKLVTLLDIGGQHRFHEIRQKGLRL